MSKPYFKVFQSTLDEQWYWHLVGGNGEIMCESEAYVSQSHAMRAADRFPLVTAEAQGNIQAPPMTRHDQ